MEKRTILAFLLSFIVLIGWSVLFSPGKDQRHQPPKAHQGEEATKTAVKGPGKDNKEGQAPFKTPSTMVPKVIPEADEGVTEVDTPLYKAVFSNVGPAIRSFKLKRYSQTMDPQSPLIELVALKKGLGDFLHLDFTVPSMSPEGKRVYQVDRKALRLGPGASPRELVFRSSTQGGLLLKKVFRFYPDQYKIDFKQEVINQSERPVKGGFSTRLMALPPQKKRSYYTYVGLVILLNNKLEKVKIKKTSDQKVLKGHLDWMGYENDFFISAIVPEGGSEGIFRGRLLATGMLEGSYSSPEVSLKPFEKASAQYTLYLGPLDMGVLKQLGKKLDRAINFGWTDIIAKPLLSLLRFFDQYIHNYGISIILLTVLIKILFWPLTHKSYKSMGEMKKLQPHLAKLKQKYKDNKEQLNKEMMALYKTYKVNPMGGCLPMVIQIPVFFALYRILGSAIELRHAPFFLWINDLSAPDRLFNFPFQIPFMKPPYGIPVLTLLMGASMFVQQKMTPTPGDPTQAKVMMFLPLIFTFMFINFPSGLVLYWLINNILSIGQQYRIQKKSA